MIEQRFAIIVSNEESSLSFPIPVRSTQQFRSLKRVIESCVKKELQLENPRFICIFNGKAISDTDTLEEIGIIEGSCISLVFLNEGDSELTYDSIIRNYCAADEVDNQLEPIYKLIDNRQVTDAFAQIRTALFSMSNIPKAVEKLRLRFANIEYHPLIYAGVHELLFSAFKSSVSHDVFLSLLGWYKFIVPKIQKEQRCASASLMIEILKCYSEDSQVINILIPILYNLLNPEDSDDVVKCLGYPEAIDILFACTNVLTNSSTLIHVMMILNHLLSSNNSLLDTLNPTTSLDYISRFLAHCSSAIGTNSLLDLTQTLLMNSKFLIAFESKRFLFIFRKYISNYDSVQIRRLCFFFSVIAKNDCIKSQLIVSGLLETIISFSNSQPYDIDLLYSVLLLIEQLCTRNEYCIYLTNLGVIDAIQSYLSIHKIESILIPVAFRCFEEIITNSWICREHIWDLSTLESLFALLIPEQVSFPVILAFIKLLKKINEFESGRDSLRTLNAVEFINAFSDLFDDNLQQFQQLRAELNALQTSNLLHQSSDYDYVYIVPKLLHNNKCSLEIRRRDVMKRTPSSTSIRQSTILRQIQNYDSSSEIDFSASIKTVKDPMANGEDFYSFLLTDLDSSSDTDYLVCLVRCLSVLLDPGLFEGIRLYVDMSLIPSILAKVMSSHSEELQIIQGGVVIISTIAQSPFHCNNTLVDSMLDLLLKGDVIEVLNKMIYQYLSDYTVCGHAVYVLYLLSKQNEYIDRLIRASVMNSLRYAARETLDVYIRGYALYALRNLGEDNLPRVPCPEIDLEKPLTELLLDDIESTNDNEHRIQILNSLALAFKYDYKEIQQAFFESNGEGILEDVIRNNTNSPDVILSVLKVFQAALLIPHNIQYMEQKNLTGICINVLLRYHQIRDLVKVALQIIQSLCDHSSSAAVIVPYLPNLHGLLHDYGTVKSICSGIIRILVLVAQIGDQSQFSIINSGILNTIDEVVLIHISHRPLILNIFTLFEILSSTNGGADYLATHCCFSISIKVLQRFMKEESAEYDDIMKKALLIIQRIIEKRPDAMSFFLEAQGYSTVVRASTLKTVSRIVRQTGLSCLMFLLQNEMGDDQLQPLNLLPTLFQSENDVSWMTSIWMCCSYYIEYHYQLLTTDDISLVYSNALQSLPTSMEDRNLVIAVIRTLFAYATSPSLLKTHEVKFKSISTPQAVSVLADIDYKSLCQTLTSASDYYSQDIVFTVQASIVRYCLGNQETTDRYLSETISILRNSLQNLTMELLDTLVRVCEISVIANQLLDRETFTLLLNSLRQSLNDDRKTNKILAILCSFDPVRLVEDCDVNSLIRLLQELLSEHKEMTDSTLFICTLFIEMMSDYASVLSHIVQSSFLSSFLPHFSMATSVDVLLHAFNIVFKVVHVQKENKEVRDWLVLLEKESKSNVDDSILVRFQLLQFGCNSASTMISASEVVTSFLRYTASGIEINEAISLCEILTHYPSLCSLFIDNGGKEWLHGCLENNDSNPSVVEAIRVLYSRCFSNNSAWLREYLYLFSLEHLQHRNEVFHQLYQLLTHLDWSDSHSPSLEAVEIQHLLEGIKRLDTNDRECMDTISLLCLCLQHTGPDTANSIVEMILQLAEKHKQSLYVLDLVQSILEDLQSDIRLSSTLYRLSRRYLLGIFQECNEESVEIVCGMIKIVTPNEKSTESFAKEDSVSIVCGWIEKATRDDTLSSLCSLLLWIGRYEETWAYLRGHNILLDRVNNVVMSTHFESTILAYKKLSNVLQQGVTYRAPQKESFPHRPAPPILCFNK